MHFKIYPSVFLFTLAMLFLHIDCDGQKDSAGAEKKFNNIIKTNPLSTIQGPIFLLGEQRVLYEHKLGTHKSVELGASYLAANSLIEEELFATVAAIAGLVMYTGFLPKNISFSTSTDKPVLDPWSTTGYRLQASYRYYINRNHMRGFYTSLRISDSEAHGWVMFEGKIPFRVNLFNATGNIGCQFINQKGFTVDIYAGLGYKRITSHYSNDPVKTKNGIKFSFGFNAGIAF